LLNDKKVLITGGTGTFGKKMVKFLLNDTNCKKIYVLSRDELKQSEMQQELKFNNRLSFLIGDIKDKERLIIAFSGIDYVIHAAAQKHVPSCEYNPFEAVKTNIIGAQNIIEAAIFHKIEKVIALSTDKAVEPVNLYGSTKNCMEKLFINGNAYSGGTTKFSVVRYGNVINSRGSIIPIWKKQKEQNKKLLLTDTEMTRFVISVKDAVKFVYDSLNIMNGAEIFIPVLESIKMFDISKTISNNIKIIGIREGEKIHETLISSKETGNIFLKKNKDKKSFYVIYPNFLWFKNIVIDGLVKVLNGFEYSSCDYINSSQEKIKEILADD
jgi:UDP-N-acetylglucosamine 4,6-dehydratase